MSKVPWRRSINVLQICTEPGGGARIGTLLTHAQRGLTENSYVALTDLQEAVDIVLRCLIEYATEYDERTGLERS
jgi:hypothetical protein